MRFILQKTDTINIDMLLLKEILTRRCMIDSYEEMTIQELREAEKKQG